MRMKNNGVALEPAPEMAAMMRRCVKVSHTDSKFCYRCEKFTQPNQDVSESAV
jgi:hypothetical protein